MSRAGFGETAGREIGLQRGFCDFCGGAGICCRGFFDFVDENQVPCAADAVLVRRQCARFHRTAFPAERSNGALGGGKLMLHLGALERQKASAHPHKGQAVFAEHRQIAHRTGGRNVEFFPQRGIFAAVLGARARGPL